MRTFIEIGHTHPHSPLHCHTHTPLPRLATRNPPGNRSTAIRRRVHAQRCEHCSSAHRNPQRYETDAHQPHDPQGITLRGATATARRSPVPPVSVDRSEAPNGRTLQHAPLPEPHALHSPTRTSRRGVRDATATADSPTHRHIQLPHPTASHPTQCTARTCTQQRAPQWPTLARCSPADKCARPAIVRGALRKQGRPLPLPNSRAPNNTEAATAARDAQRPVARVHGPQTHTHTPHCPHPTAARAWARHTRCPAVPSARSTLSRSSAGAQSPSRLARPPTLPPAYYRPPIVPPARYTHRCRVLSRCRVLPCAYAICAVYAVCTRRLNRFRAGGVPVHNRWAQQIGSAHSYTR